jgi:hypothetical protein
MQCFSGPSILGGNLTHCFYIHPLPVQRICRFRILMYAVKYLLVRRQLFSAKVYTEMLHVKYG